METNPIEELYSIKKLVMKHLKDEKSSPQYQLQKYYPNIYKTLKEKQFLMMQDCVRKNLERGVDLGIFRKDIHIDFIARLYFNGMLAIKDNDLFPAETFSVPVLMSNYLEYHLRGICTLEGLETLKNHVQSNQS